MEALLAPISLLHDWLIDITVLEFEIRTPEINNK